MEIITIVSRALNLATPFLTKTGEEIERKVGEEIWNFIQKPFNSYSKAPTNLNVLERNQFFKQAMSDYLIEDPYFEIKLQILLDKSLKKLGKNSLQIRYSSFRAVRL